MDSAKRLIVIRIHLVLACGKLELHKKLVNAYILGRLQAAFSDGLIERTRKEVRMRLAVSGRKLFSETNGSHRLIAVVI